MVNGKDNVWPKERVEQLLKLRDEGHGPTDIGRMMCITRNAVIGKLHRLGLTGQRQKNGGLPIKPSVMNKRILVAPKVKQLREIAVKMRQALPPVPLPAPETFEAGYHPLNLSLLELPANGCRWPVNNAAPNEMHLFCGHPKAEGKSYCERHVERSISRAAPRNRKIKVAA